MALQDGQVWSISQVLQKRIVILIFVTFICVLGIYYTTRPYLTKTETQEDQFLQPNYNLHIFYYPWYGNPQADGMYSIIIPTTTYISKAPFVQNKAPQKIYI